MILFPIIQARLKNSRNNEVLANQKKSETFAHDSWVIINQTLFGTVKNETRKIVIVVAGLFLNQFLIKEFHLKHLIYQRHLH